MMKGKKYMKVLRIYNKRGEFLDKESTYKSVKKIDKNDIINLLEVIYDVGEKAEVDEMDDENSIVNEAEKIIYKNLKKEIEEFKSKLSDLKNEIETQYKAITEELEEQESND